MTVLGYLFCAFIGGSMLFGWWWIERSEPDPWEELARRAHKRPIIYTTTPRHDPNSWDYDDPTVIHRGFAWEDDAQVKAEKLQADADYEHRMNEAERGAE